MYQTKKSYQRRTLNEIHYILSNNKGETYKLTSKELTKFCLDHLIHRGSLCAAMYHKRLYKGWTLVKEDNDHNHRIKIHRKSDITRKKISEKLKGKTRTLEQKKHAKEVQQRTYVVTDPTGKNYTIRSADVKNFCKTFKLCYGTLMSAKKRGKLYKKWKIIELTKQSD